MRRIIAIVIAIILALSTVPTFATNVTQNEATAVKVLCLSDSLDLYSKSDSIKQVEVSSFNRNSLEDYVFCKIIAVGENDFTQVDSDKLIELIDNGTVLYVGGDGITLDVISEHLNTPTPDKRSVNGATITGVFVININNCYCYGITSRALCDPINWDSPDYYNNTNKRETIINELVQKNGPNQSILYIDDFIKAISAIKSNFVQKSITDTNDDIVYLQLPSKSFDGTPWYDYIALESSGFQFGSVQISQYRYEICKYTENSVSKAITDIVTNFTISPYSTMYVNNYYTRIRANFTTMDIIGQSYLNSNQTTSHSYTLSGGVNPSNPTIMSGSLSAATTNTYTTNNQTIQNDFYAQKYKNWNPTPTKKWVGASWEIEPAVRVINTDAIYNSQVYSSFQNGGWIGVQNVLGFTIPNVEVGGYWFP